MLQKQVDGWTTDADHEMSPVGLLAQLSNLLCEFQESNDSLKKINKTKNHSSDSISADITNNLARCIIFSLKMHVNFLSENLQITACVHPFFLQEISLKTQSLHTDLAIIPSYTYALFLHSICKIKQKSSHVTLKQPNTWPG